MNDPVLSMFLNACGATGPLRLHVARMLAGDLAGVLAELERPTA